MIGENIKKFRKARGLSQNDLAQKTNLTKRAIAYYEKEADNEIFNKLQLIADALNVTLADLLDNSGTKTNAEIDVLDTRTIKKIIKVKQLPQRAQNIIWEHIDYIIEKNKNR